MKKFGAEPGCFHAAVSARSAMVGRAQASRAIAASNPSHLPHPPISPITPVPQSSLPSGQRRVCVGCTGVPVAPPVAHPNSTQASSAVGASRRSVAGAWGDSGAGRMSWLPRGRGGLLGRAAPPRFRPLFAASRMTALQLSCRTSMASPQGALVRVVRRDPMYFRRWKDASFRLTSSTENALGSKSSPTQSRNSLC